MIYVHRSIPWRNYAGVPDILDVLVSWWDRLNSLGTNWEQDAAEGTK
jgi:hypothetical protein